MNDKADGNSSTDFGFRQIPREEKTHRVRDVFRSVAGRYDLMNDLMSAGLHRLWKRQTVNMAGLRPGHRVLDLAAGTGDLSRLMAGKVGAEGRIVMSDINDAMLDQGRSRLLDEGVFDNIEYVLADAEKLPFPDNHFDRVTMAFGLRNVTDKPAALAEIHRVLRPGGFVLVLEFSQLYIAPLRPVYELYSFQILPRMGKLIANDADSYRYLAESIRMHPDQDTLKQMMEDVGLEDCDYTNMSGGVVAVHRGYKY